MCIRWTLFTECGFFARLITGDTIYCFIYHHEYYQLFIDSSIVHKMNKRRKNRWFERQKWTNFASQLILSTKMTLTHASEVLTEFPHTWIDYMNIYAYEFHHITPFILVVVGSVFVCPSTNNDKNILISLSVAIEIKINQTKYKKNSITHRYFS